MCGLVSPGQARLSESPLYLPLLRALLEPRVKSLEDATKDGEPKESWVQRHAFTPEFPKLQAYVCRCNACSSPVHPFHPHTRCYLLAPGATWRSTAVTHIHVHTLCVWVLPQTAA